MKFNDRDFIKCQASEIADKLSQTWGICEVGEVSNFNRVIWISEKINECICYSNNSFYQNCGVYVVLMHDLYIEITTKVNELCANGSTQKRA